MKDWLKRLWLLIITGCFLFLCFGSLLAAINWIFLIGVIGTFYAVSVLISSIIALVVFFIIALVLIGIFACSFIGSKEDVKTPTTEY